MGAYSTTNKPATNRLTLQHEFDIDWDKDGFFFSYSLPNADSDVKIEARHKNVGEDFAAWIELTIRYRDETFVFEALGVEQANAILSAFDLGVWVGQ